MEQPGGQSALTVARHLGGQRYLVRLHTGRTHQIRVHFAWLGAPLKGDARYGRPSDTAQQAPRLGLHCHALLLPEIADGISRPQRFTSPPADFPGSAPGASAGAAPSRRACANPPEGTDSPCLPWARAAA